MLALKRLALLLVVPGVIWLACGEPDESFGPVDQAEKSPHSIARATWQNNGIDNYIIEQRVGFYGPVGFQGWVQLEIADNEITDALYLDENREPTEYEIIWYRTIDELFEFIESESDADSVIITYDSVYGYPDYIFNNRNIDVCDDEMAYFTRLIQAED